MRLSRYFHGLILCVILIGLNNCYVAERPLQDYLRPVRRLLYKQRTYWTDKINYRGKSGSEMVYYKQGRQALERYFDARGLLVRITYFGRSGAIMRTDSLVYAQDELIAGYFFAEPGHQLVQRFLSYKQQGQLSQRSWFDGSDRLLSREFFLFDRQGNRRMRLIFDGQDSLLFSETFAPLTDDLQIQNTYSHGRFLTQQIRYEHGVPDYSYTFDTRGRINRVTRLQADGSTGWVSDLAYAPDGNLASSTFSIRGQFLFTYLGDLEIIRQDLHSWRNPDQPGLLRPVFMITHQDPFETSYVSEQGHPVLEYRLPHSGALFQRSLLDSNSHPITDTLYASRGILHPISVINYDVNGFVATETSYSGSGSPAWKHTYFRDAAGRVIREEVSAQPDSFTAAVTRIYDAFDEPALSEKFSAADSFDGSWVFYQGGGVVQTYYYNDLGELAETWMRQPAGDTLRHARFQTLDYFRVESRLGNNDTLLTQRRFTANGILDWELQFDGTGQLTQELYRKKDGTTYRQVTYEPETRLIKSITYAPTEIDQAAEISSEVITRLNKQGQTLQIVSRNSSGELNWEKRYAYRGGKLLKSAQLDADGKPAVISSYTHNKWGQIVTELALDQQGDTVHTVYHRYNDKHAEVLRTFKSTQIRASNSNRFFYNAAGLVRRNEIIEDQHLLEAIEYNYYPEYFLRIAIHYNPAGELTRKEIENYFGDNVFALGSKESSRGK